MEYLILGQTLKPVGLKGEIKIYSKTDFSSLRYKRGNFVYYLNENNVYTPLKVHSFRESKPFDIVSFENYLDINLISKLLNKTIYIKKSDAKIPEGYFHYIDLIGLNVIFNNKNVGVIEKVLEIPANILLRVKYNGKHYDIPYVETFINKIDLDKKIIDVNLIEGML